jgi:hypothetical protein
MTNCNRTYSNAGIQLSQIGKLKQSPGADNASHETESSFFKKGNPGLHAFGDMPKSGLGDIPKSPDLVDFLAAIQL